MRTTGGRTVHNFTRIITMRTQHNYYEFLVAVFIIVVIVVGLVVLLSINLYLMLLEATIVVIVVIFESYTLLLSSCGDRCMVCKVMLFIKTSTVELVVAV